MTSEATAKSPANAPAAAAVSVSDVFVVLPAYNEEQNMPAIFASLETFAQTYQGKLKVIVVDDGSKDGTVAVSHKHGKNLDLQVVEHVQNRGLGGALRTGLKTALASAQDQDVVVLLDADNSHDPSHIHEMAERIAGGDDVVIASRYAEGGQEVGLSLPRKLGSRCVSFALSVLFPVANAKDYTCGFRAYKASVLRRALTAYGDNLITETSFVCMAELLIKLSSVGARVGESPLILRYDLKGGASKMNIPKTLMRYAYFVISQAPVITKTARNYR